MISVDTKKKELVGNYKNGGTDYRPKGDPQRVKVHDFEDKDLGKVVPYGVYDVGDEHRVGQRRHHARHGRVRRRSRSARWLARMGRPTLPQGSAS